MARLDRLAFWAVFLPSISSGFTVVRLPLSRQTYKAPPPDMINSRFSQLLARDFVDDEEEEYARVPRRRQRGRLYEEDQVEEEFFEDVERRIYGEDVDFEEDEDDWDDDDDEDDDDDLGLFSNVLIDNPILDSIDPDGAAERFPELARDPRFWFDMFLFVVFLDLLSAIGPQDYFPDIPYFV